MSEKPVWIDKFEELDVYSFPFRAADLLITGFLV
jgi:hypothetical protein|tara:strand:- start:335 stop:436 length:102 start_codon:yes stop_codon:yes gene_type:complete